MYDLNDHFSGRGLIEISVLCVVCSLGISLACLCMTGEIGFSSCHLSKVTESQIAVLASAACLFSIRLRKLVFPVAV